MKKPTAKREQTEDQGKARKTRKATSSKQAKKMNKK